MRLPHAPRDARETCAGVLAAPDRDRVPVIRGGVPSIVEQARVSIARQGGRMKIDKHGQKVAAYDFG